MSTNASAPVVGVAGEILESVPAPQEPFDIPSTTLGASSGGKSYTAIYSETPNNGTTMFDGQEANSSTISLTVNENGAPIATEIDTVYYLENPYQPLGMSISANGRQFDFLYNSTDPLPSTLAAGNSGPLGSGTYYVVNTNDGIGSLTETYSVTAWGGQRRGAAAYDLRYGDAERQDGQRNDHLRPQRPPNTEFGRGHRERHPADVYVRVRWLLGLLVLRSDPFICLVLRGMAAPEAI